MPVNDLTEPERRLWHAYPRDELVDLRTGDPTRDDPADGHAWENERTVRAEVITALLLGAVEAEPGHRSGVRLKGVRISGKLDLDGVAFDPVLQCEDCYFDEAVSCVEATARTLLLRDCALPGLDGARMRLEGRLDLSGSVISGALRLDHARLDSEVRLRGTMIGTPGGEGDLVVEAAGLRVGGRLDLSSLITHGSVLLSQSHVSGPVHLRNAQIKAETGTAPGRPQPSLSRQRPRFAPPRQGLRAEGVVVDSILTCDFLTIDGGLWLDNARVSASIQLWGAVLNNPGDIALGGGGLTVDGAVWCQQGFIAEGEVRLVGARLGANLAMQGAQLSNPGGIALNLDRAVVGEVEGAGLTAAGGVTAEGVQVSSVLRLTGASLDAGTGERALSIENASISLLMLREMRVQGQIMVRTSQIGSRVLLMGTQVHNPGHVALRLSRTKVGADLFCDRLSAEGEVKLTQASVTGHADFTGAVLKNPGGTALDARWLTAGQVTLQPGENVEGAVQLAHARIGVLRDDPERWSSPLTLTGLAYEDLEPRLPPGDRLRWLTLDPAGFQSQPYEQLAAHYTAMGQHADARTVMYARERHRRVAESFLGRSWGRLQDVTTGYGYRPWRAAVWLVALLTIGAIVYRIEQPEQLKPDETPHFNPVVYTLDLLLPIVELGQERAFNPAGAYQWFSYVLIAAGWILATTIAAGVARVLGRR